MSKKALSQKDLKRLEQIKSKLAEVSEAIENDEYCCELEPEEWLEAIKDWESINSKLKLNYHYTFKELQAIFGEDNVEPDSRTSHDITYGSVTVTWYKNTNMNTPLSCYVDFNGFGQVDLRYMSDILQIKGASEPFPKKKREYMYVLIEDVFMGFKNVTPRSIHPTLGKARKALKELRAKQLKVYGYDGANLVELLLNEEIAGFSDMPNNFLVEERDLEMSSFGCYIERVEVKK